MKIFISYSHKQGDWVCERLVPCLKAAGAEILLDKELFGIGQAVIGQMDATQDQADKQLLVLTEDYLASKYCQHEMKRALKKDPKFAQGLVLPIVRQECTLPKAFTGWNPPLYATMQDDKKPEIWQLLLKACEANNLGCTVPEWLRVRDELVRHLGRNKSVNLVISGKPNWEGLLKHVIADYFPHMAWVNLDNPRTFTRKGLLTTICQAIGNPISINDEPRPDEPPPDLCKFADLLDNRSMTYTALIHFDAIKRHESFDGNFFDTLRYQIMDQRNLALLIQSRTPFAMLLPQNHPMSHIDVTTVELAGNP